MTRSKIIAAVAVVAAVAGLVVVFSRARAEDKPKVDNGSVIVATQPTETSTPKPKVEDSGAKTEHLVYTPIGYQDSDLNEAQRLIDNDKYVDARDLMAKAYADPKLSGAQRDKMEELMLKVAQGVYFDKPIEKDFVIHTCESGESLYKIAEKYRKSGVKVEYGMIKLLNGMKNNNLRLGSRLKIPKGTFSIVVRKSTFKLYVLYNGIACKSYRIAIGTDNKTPAAKFTAGNKTPEPTWWPPEGSGLRGPIGPKDPRNPLGTHWIALESTQYPGLGIHGTIDPSSIGKNASQGCVRMLNEDVKEIFELVYPGMEVTIYE